MVQQAMPGLRDVLDRERGTAYVGFDPSAAGLHRVGIINMAEKKICFVIAPIGEEDSPLRRRSEKVFEEVIRPATKKCGYLTVHLTDISRSGLITNDIIKHIVSAPLVIADLSGGNPNVFYELALRHAVGKPVVQLVAGGEEIPFNVMDTRTISYELDEVASRKKAMSEIVKQIQMIERDASPLESPVSIAGIRTPLTLEALPPLIKYEDMMLKEYLETAAENMPAEVRTLLNELKKISPIHLLEDTGDDLDAACTLVEHVQEGGYISATSSLQHHDADERLSYRTVLNEALKRDVTYRKIICSSSDLTYGRYVTWKEEFEEKASLIRAGEIGPVVFQLLHYPSPMSVDVLISQAANGDCLEMVAGFAGGEGHGGFHTDDKRMVEEWLNIYLEAKIIPDAEQHTKAVSAGTEKCSCSEFLSLLDDARKAAPQPEPVLRNTRPKRKTKSLTS